LRNRWGLAEGLSRPRLAEGVRFIFSPKSQPTLLFVDKEEDEVKMREKREIDWTLRKKSNKGYLWYLLIFLVMIK
jgi:hypothetical protein